VRPAIIESAWSEPVPGWIRGFRMAEPVIISYARGLLKEFPGVPEGTVDVIPVDLVVGAIIGVAARGPSNADGSPDITQVASGSANPLKYERLVDLVQRWFAEHPLYDAEGQPIAVPDWGYTTRNRVQGQLERAKSALEKTEKVIGALPLRGKQAAWSAKVEEQRDTVISRALTYVELYGAYTACEAIYGVDKPARDAGVAWPLPTSRVLHGPAGRGLGPLRPPDPPAVGRGARPGPHRRQEGSRRVPRRPPAPPGAVPRPPAGGVRPREHAHRLQRGHQLRLAGHAPPGPRRQAPPHRQAHRRGARAC
jgi:hypothetical protein